MTNKTRKRIWPVALMSLAVFGVLAAVVALSVMTPQTSQAHGCDDAASAVEEAECIRDHVAAGLDPNAAHEHDPNVAPTATGSLPDLSLRISMTHGPTDVTGEFEDADGDDLTYSASSDNPNVADAVVQNGMMTVTAGNIRGTARIMVTADDGGNEGTASVSFNVEVAEAYTLTAESADPAAPSTYVVEDLGEYDAKFDLAVAGSLDDVTVTVTASEDEDGGISITDSDGLIGAGFVDEDETDLEGSLTVKATDQGSRAFEIEGECITPGAMATIIVEDKDLDEVARGYILCAEPEEPPPPPDEVTKAECYSVTGYMGDDEDEAMDLRRDDIEPHERPAHPTNPEMGQDTIEILEGSADVQITVTSCEAGPVYIRFLDSDMEVFGTDVDECETCEGAAGADVVGLDSQQKLELNLAKDLSDYTDSANAAKALMYDQYNVVTPGDGSDMYLVGEPGMYYQGKFRFIAPCDQGDFYVEVYEKQGKVLQELQNGMMRELVTCVPPEEVEAQPISVTQGSRDSGEMIVEWEEIEGAVEYTVAVLDTTDPAMYTVAYADMFATTAARTTTVTGLTSGTRYIFAVYAELADGSYSPVEFVINTPEFTQS